MWDRGDRGGKSAVRLRLAVRMMRDRFRDIDSERRETLAGGVGGMKGMRGNRLGSADLVVATRVSQDKRIYRVEQRRELCNFLCVAARRARANRHTLLKEIIGQRHRLSEEPFLWRENRRQR